MGHLNFHVSPSNPTHMHALSAQDPASEYSCICRVFSAPERMVSLVRKDLQSSAHLELITWNLSRLAGYKDVPVSPSITSLVSTPLFDNGNSMPAATLPQPESPCYHPMSRRSFSAPNLDETLNKYYSSYDLSSCSWPSRQSHGRSPWLATHPSHHPSGGC